MKRLLKNENGHAMVIVALMMVALMGICGLVIDGGSLYLQKSKAQKAVDAAALAGAQTILKDPSNVSDTAKQYGAANGLDKNEMKVTTNQSSVTVTATKTIPLNFMSLLGIKSKDVSVLATAEVKSGSSVFGYVLFSADTNSNLAFSGSHTANGNVHINGGATISGNNQFNGNLEVAGSFTKSGNNQINKLINPANNIAMPNFDIDYYRKNATKTYSTNLTLSGTTNLNGITFVNGDVTISGKTKGVGTIVATGTITISGSLEYSSGNDFIGLFGQNGITISGGNSINGFLYSPKGSIVISGSGNFYGALIAKSLVISGEHTYTYDSRVATSQATNAVLTK